MRIEIDMYRHRFSFFIERLLGDFRLLRERPIEISDSLRDSYCATSLCSRFPLQSAMLYLRFQAKEIVNEPPLVSSARDNSNAPAHPNAYSNTAHNEYFGIEIGVVSTHPLQPGIAVPELLEDE